MQQQPRVPVELAPDDVLEAAADVLDAREKQRSSAAQNAGDTTVRDAVGAVTMNGAADAATARETAERLRHEAAALDADDGLPFGRPGRPLRRGSPFLIGFTGALGVLVAFGLTRALVSASSVLVLIVVSMFLAVGLNPSVVGLQRRGMRRGFAVTAVFLLVLLLFLVFGLAVAPPLAEQIASFGANLPDYLQQLQQNTTVSELNERYGLIERAQAYIRSGDLAEQAFGGIVGVGRIIFGAAFSALTVLILTLYFLSSLPSITAGAYSLVPRSRRTRIQLLGDEILGRVGGYVSGAGIVASCAGISTFVFLEIIGLREYALALALLVALFDLIPMIGATLGATVVTVVGLVDSLTIGVACLIFFVVYQQVENYLIYPRVMKRSVDVPPALTVIAALLGGALFGVVGALLAIPTAASLLLIIREVVVPRQEQS
ncbi:MAG: AI-2E family transporter [Acidothermales bacterium]|nr:AI-2E family transporter [Acidothermales bacterium]